MTSSRLFGAAALLAALAGCEWKITSRVAVQVCAGSAPVEGASVRVECTGRAARAVGKTDAYGWLLANSEAPVGAGCALAIDHVRGHARVQVDEVCSIRDGNECRALEARVKLEPVRDERTAKRG